MLKGNNVNLKNSISNHPIKTTEICIDHDETGDVKFHIPLFDESYQYYWTKDKAEHNFLFNSILQRISDIIIHQPYQLAPQLYFDGKINNEKYRVYRPNHDTTHAARQLRYAKQYLNFIKLHANDIWKNVYDSLTSEERAIILLATFSLRLGRRNEASESSGSKHPLHSAQLFELIALQLGFNPLLVNNIKLAMCSKAPRKDEVDRYDAFASLDADSLRLHKAELTQLLFSIVHRNDLVRCWDSKGDNKFFAIKNPIASKLASLLNDNNESEPSSLCQEQADASAELMMNYAARCCLATGNKVRLKELNYDYPKYNKNLKALCTKDLEQCFTKLKTVNKPFSKNR